MQNWCGRFVLVVSVLLHTSASYAAVDFNRDIKPILSDRCYTCHGPDQSKRKSKLRLDLEEGVKGAKDSIVRRIRADDATRMPPAWAGAAKLPAREVDLISKWIAEGAPWQKHWSFVPPRRPEVPAGRNAIDYFVRARLEREGLQPSPEADRRTLIRRLSLDLTGLPASPAEVQAFLADASPNAYERVVDRLLQSPHYGERMAQRWLDAARYADTNGYQTDGERYMFRWRDWVIDAFNRNQPYDQFALEQIAGDLLPGATRSQILATGFNRNHRGNGEGGIIPEEYAVEYVVDRVETTSTVFLGVTMGCARCHNHKYDPFSQKEFYQLFAYFNNVPERGKAFKYGNSPPVIPAPTAAQEVKLNEAGKALEAAQSRLQAMEPAIAKAQVEWETNAPDVDWSPGRAVAVRMPLRGSLQGEIHRDPPRSIRYQYTMENGPVVQQAPPPLVFTPEWKGEGTATAFDGKRYVEVGNVADFGFYDSFTMAAWIKPLAADGVVISRAKDVAEGQGISLALNNGHLQANLVQRWLDDGGRLESEAMVPLGQWSHVMLTYDGTRVAGGIRLYLNGQLLQVKVNLDDLNQSFAAKEPLRIGPHFTGEIRDVLVYREALTSADAAVLAVPESLAALGKMKIRTTAQAAKLRRAFLDRYAPAPMREAAAKIDELRVRRDELIESFPTVMVMQENPSPCETHVLLRGAYDKPGERVNPGVPAVLPGLAQGEPNNRLGLARWLIDPGNPLTARVAVNRFWQIYFGSGLVKTVEDFGSQGEWPSHPELLDWLATEFIRTGWDMKAMQKTIVMSATYRQASKTNAELTQRDPDNRLLARGPRVRLPAETVRDQALAVSGLLVRKIGGPSVKPYQPAGLWKELSGGDDYQPDKGDGLHRRSLYTFWKRTAPPPMMMNFDAAGREMCTVREVRTNTPLQALDLMNDEVFLEAARALGGQMKRDGGLTRGFELVLSRPPTAREEAVMRSSLAYYMDTVGEARAWEMMASLLLNLDEAVTKQ